MSDYDEDEYDGLNFEEASEEEDPAPALEPVDEFSNLKHSKFQANKLLKQQQKEQQKLQKEQEKLLKMEERERERQYKIQLREIQKQEKQANKKPKTQKPNITYSIDDENDFDDDNMFSETGTEILGRDKMVLLKKVSQFKQLFPEKLKSFKIKKNANEEELKLYIQEMESIIEVSNIDEFVYDSIIQSIKVVEGVSSYTKYYNVQGMADMLKMNPEFKNLCKLMFIKYNVFSAVPVEYQLVMIISTTAFICRSKNMNKDKINDFLNKAI